MLIRTRSEVVEKVYSEFLRAFPGPRELCEAGLSSVLNFFRMLGLPRRAEMLKEAVCKITEEYGGVLPCDYWELTKLPGVGRYIARVLLTRVCGMPVPFVDSNVVRFARRFLGLGSISVGQVEAWLERSVPRALLEEVNVAILDLAGVVCKPREPRCGACPVKTWCNYGNIA